MMEERLSKTEEEVVRCLIRHKGGYVSTDTISEELNVDKSYLTKLTSDLKEKGLEIEKQGKQGKACSYRLVGEIEETEFALSIMLRPEGMLDWIARDCASDREVEKVEESFRVQKILARRGVPKQNISEKVEELEHYEDEVCEYLDRMEELEEEKEEFASKLMKIDDKKEQARKDLYDSMITYESLKQKYLPKVGADVFSKWLGSISLGVLKELREKDFSDQWERIIVSEFNLEIQRQLEQYLDHINLNDFEGLVARAIGHEGENRNGRDKDRK